eukprot:UN00470
MLEEQKYDDEYADDVLQSDNDTIPWHFRTFPSWCPVIHFSPMEDGLHMTSIFAARIFKYQWYGTLASSVMDFITTIILFATKQRHINTLGSSFLICFGVMALATYAFFISYRFLIYQTTKLQRSGIFLYTILASMTCVFSLLSAGPFHGWFAIQLEIRSSSISCKILMILLSIDCIFWNLLCLVTIFVVIRLFMHTKMSQNKMSGYVAYAYTLT